MERSFYICCDCYDYLESIDPSVSETWLNLCILLITSRQTFGFREVNEDITRVLEEEGFIVTHEEGDYILFKIKGYYQEDDIEGFCICEYETCE